MGHTMGHTMAAARAAVPRPRGEPRSPRCHRPYHGPGSPPWAGVTPWCMERWKGRRGVGGVRHLLSRPGAWAQPSAPGDPRRRPERRKRGQGKRRDRGTLRGPRGVKALVGAVETRDGGRRGTIAGWSGCRRRVPRRLSHIPRRLQHPPRLNLRCCKVPAI